MLLAQHPKKLARVRSEVDRLVSGRTATFGEYRQLRYTQMVLYETLRLFPTVPSFPRLSVKRCKLGEYDIPTGTLVVVSQQPMNRDEAIWGTDAHLFIPERFDPGEGRPLPQLRPTKPVGVPGGHNFGFVPFGAGQRTCVGQRLAVMEGTMILATVAKGIDFELVSPGTKVDECADVTLGPKAGLWMRPKLRAQLRCSRL
jgi:cytochrome P450